MMFGFDPKPWEAPPTLLKLAALLQKFPLPGLLQMLGFEPNFSNWRYSVVVVFVTIRLWLMSKFLRSVSRSVDL